tara:strand:+ start:490 stop:687 length:198 start_codon:yes stop_codon:yes gene_type:complete
VACLAGSSTILLGGEAKSPAFGGHEDGPINIKTTKPGTQEQKDLFQTQRGHNQNRRMLELEAQLN